MIFVAKADSLQMSVVERRIRGRRAAAQTANSRAVPLKKRAFLSCQWRLRAGLFPHPHRDFMIFSERALLLL